MPQSSSEHVLTGRTLPLTPAPITRAVWRTCLPPEVLDPAHPDSPLHVSHKVRGYRFAWGHLLERVVPPDAEEPAGLRCWDVVLTDAQRQYQAGGGSLDELADMALVFLDTSMPQHAPPWLRDDDGALPAAFALLVGPAHAQAARQWLRRYLGHGLPRLLAFVLEINAEAQRAHDQA